MNSDSIVAKGSLYEEPRPDLVALRYRRNIRIYNNIVKLGESPNGRILVIYGEGHLGWPRQNIANDATVKPVAHFSGEDRGGWGTDIR
jgi:hypothetical protein